MQTIKTKVQDLKKGDKVLKYGQIYEITEDAVNYGFCDLNCNHSYTGTKKDVWAADCKILTEPKKDYLYYDLVTYDSMQGNGLAIELKIIE